MVRIDIEMPASCSVCPFLAYDGDRQEYRCCVDDGIRFFVTDVPKENRDERCGIKEA